MTSIHAGRDRKTAELNHQIAEEAQADALADIFPRGRGELPDEVVACVARQVGVPATDLAFYE